MEGSSGIIRYGFITVSVKCIFEKLQNVTVSVIRMSHHDSIP